MSEELLINPSDFDSAKIKIDINNTTTGTELVDGYKRLGSTGVQGKPEKSDVEVKITELLDHGFKLEIPTKFCSKGHNCLVRMDVKNNDTELDFEASGKVMAVENIDRTTDEIEFKIQQIDEDSWLQFKQMYSERQSEILKFFESVRGY